MKMKWTRLDVLLTIRFYLEHCRSGVPGPNDLQVQELASSIGKSDNSTVMRLQNIAYLDTGIGLSSVAKLDEELWEKYHEDIPALDAEIIACRENKTD